MTKKASIQPVQSAGHNTRKRTEVAHELSRFLASTFGLYQKSLFYHWNVTGPHFISLHRLFEEHYKALQQAGDDLAERIRALGHYAPGTWSEFSSLSSVQEDRRLPSDSKAMLANLMRDHERCSQEAQQVLGAAESADDDVTVDLMVQRMTFHDKTAWMLRSLQQ